MTWGVEVLTRTAGQKLVPLPKNIGWIFIPPPLKNVNRILVPAPKKPNRKLVPPKQTLIDTYMPILHSLK